MVKITFLLILLLGFIGCAKESDNSDSSSGATTTIPDLTINCQTSTSCANDGADAKSISVVFYKVSCDDLDSPTSTNAYAFGTGTASCSSGTCTGTVSSFFDLNNNSVSTVDADVSAMTVFAYIDMNDDNSGPESGDPSICEDNVDFTTAISLTGSGWADVP